MAFVVADCTFLSGAMGVSFDCTAVNGTEAIINKASATHVCYIDKVYLACGSGAKLAIFDGSGGSLKIAHSADTSGAIMNMAIDFGKDPLVMDDASNVCVSGSANGAVWGFVKYHWGHG